MASPYKIFISYSTQETALAELIRNKLNDAFRGKITFYLSKDQLLGGYPWKSKIQEALKEHDALITVLTPKYLLRPMVYIEWSAFWIDNKPAFIVTTEDVKFDDIIEPMKDRQITSLFDKESIDRMLMGICDKDAANISPIPFEISFELANLAKAVYSKLLLDEQSKSFAIFKNSPELLPNEDIKKVEILWFFLKQENDESTFKKILAKVSDNAVKATVLVELLHKNKAELVGECIDLIENRTALKPIFQTLVEQGFESTSLMDKVLEYAKTSQTTIRAFGEYLIRNGQASSELFLQVLEIMQNNVELRKLAEILIDEGRQDDKSFERIRETLFERRSDKTLGLLMEYLIKSGKYNETALIYYLKQLAAHSQKEASKPLKELIKANCVLSKKILLDIKLITNQEFLTELLQLIELHCIE